MNPVSTTASPNASRGGQEEPRSARKRKAILEAARTLFLRNGYRGTSMDEIAAAAAVSKQTVYKHFADKESLFSEIVTSTVKEAGDTVDDEVLNLQESGNVEAGPAGTGTPPARPW